MKVKIFMPGQAPKESDTTVTAKSFAQKVQKKKKTMEISILNNKPMVSREDEMKQLIAQSQASKAAKQKEEEVTKEELKAAEYDPKVAEEFHERNESRHQYVPQQSAPYSRPEEFKSSYVEMNRDDEDEVETKEDEVKTAITETIPNQLAKISEKLSEENGDKEPETAVKEETKVEDTKTEEAAAKEERAETPNPRTTATVRQSRVDDSIPGYDNGAGGKFPAKKGGQPRDKETGKFVKNK